MHIDRIIGLSSDGDFVVSTPAGTWNLMFDSATAAGRWLLSYEDAAAKTVHLVSIHRYLDSGLEAMAINAGWVGKRFVVRLSDGKKFTRPGKVPAGEILAAHGYVLVGKITAYVLVAADEASSVEAATTIIREAVDGLETTIGSVNAIDDGSSDGWCCDISLPVEGYFEHDEILDVVHGWLDRTGLEVSDFCEEARYEDVSPNTAAVISVFDEAA